MRIQIHTLPAYASWGGRAHRNEQLLEPLVGLTFGGGHLSDDEQEYVVRREFVQRAAQERGGQEKLQALLALWERDGTTMRTEIRLPVACARRVLD